MGIYMKFKTDQEEFWAGDFGDQYIKRNNSKTFLNSKIAMFGNIMRSAPGVKTVAEFGCNIGYNLLALHSLRPNLELSGYEINDSAIEQAKTLNIANIKKCSILDNIDEDPVDLTFTAAVLIHIHPDYLSSVYDNLVNNSKKYIVVAEYYNPEPTTIIYRGHSDRIFKRDFAGDLIDNYGLNLVDYGFVYKRDNVAPQDDLTWFLLSK